MILSICGKMVRECGALESCRRELFTVFIMAGVGPDVSQI
jgi:hypothetical protein